MHIHQCFFVMCGCVQVGRWPLSEEQQQMFTQMVDTAKREKTEEADKRKKFRSCRSEDI